MQITPLTVLKYLAGNRDAIESVAASRGALWLGLAFVLLAGLFREYDQEDLLRDPWYLLLPWAASSVVILVLCAVMRTLPGVRGSSLPQTEQWRRLAACFWMMAPMAAIYAVPVERFLPPPVAAETNLWLLATVSLWRVWLMARVLHVLYGDSFWRCLFCVMLIGDSAAILFTVIVPIPILEVMGGIGLTDQERVVNNARVLVFLTGGASWPIWFFGTLSNLFQAPRDSAQLISRGEAAVARSVWIGAGLGFALMLIACLWTQPEQQRASAFHALIKQGRFAEAVESLNRFSPDQLPAHWEPIPYIGRRQTTPNVFAVLQASLDHNGIQPWIVDLYARKVKQLQGTGYFATGFWDRLTDAELEVVIRLMERFSDWRTSLDDHELLWRGSLLCWIRDQLQPEEHSGGRKRDRPPELLLRLVDVANETSECPSKTEIREWIATRVPTVEIGESNRQ